MEDFINLMVSNGVSVVVVAYFLYKDWKTTGQILELMGSTKSILDKLEAFVCIKEVAK